MAAECVIMCDKCPGEATRRMKVLVDGYSVCWLDLCEQCVDGFDRWKATEREIHARCSLCGGHGWVEMLEDEMIGCEECPSKVDRAHFSGESTHNMEGKAKRAKCVHGDDECEYVDDDATTTAKCSSDEDDVDGDDDGDNVSEIARAIVKTVNEEAAAEAAAAATDKDVRGMEMICEYMRSVKEGQEAIMSRLDTIVSILGERK
jgi:hypothetical protein